jgi:hypothetical protein
MKTVSAALGAALLAFALSACAMNAVTNPVDRTFVFQADNAYGVAQSAAIAYTALPFCPKGQHASSTLYCKEQPIVIQLANADAKAQIARRALNSFVRNPANYPGLTYGQLVQAFQLAVTTMSQLEAQNGVH